MSQNPKVWIRILEILPLLFKRQICDLTKYVSISIELFQKWQIITKYVAIYNSKKVNIFCFCAYFSFSKSFDGETSRSINKFLYKYSCKIALLSLFKEFKLFENLLILAQCILYTMHFMTKNCNSTRNATSICFYNDYLCI